MSVSGVYEYVAISNAPTGILASGSIVTKPSAAQLFSYKGARGPAVSLNFDGVTFEDDMALDVFASEFSKALSLTTVSFRGAVGFNPRLFIPSLQENVSLTRLDLSHCHIDAAMMGEIAANVVPWSRTIVNWNFADNEQIGDDGALAFVTALADSMSSTQAISLRNCGIRVALVELLSTLLKLPSLLQFDASLNEMRLGADVCADALRDLDELTMRNGKMLLRNAVHRSLKTLASMPPPVIPAASATAVEPPPPAPAAAAAAVPAREAPVAAEPTPPRTLERKNSLVKKGSTGNAAANPPAATSLSASMRSNHNNSGGGGGAPYSSGSGGGTSVVRRGASPSASSPPPAAAAQQQQQQLPPPPLMVRPGASPARAATPTHGGSQHTRSPSRRGPPVGSPVRGVRQIDVDDGAEAWKRIKEQYNQFIHMPGAKPKPIVVSQPKYVLGKRIDKIKERPSSAFLCTPGMQRERQATPAELRRLAPWLADPTNKDAAFIGAEKVVLLDNGKDKLRLINGGDITAIESDPRDVGYAARKIQQREMIARPTGSFVSSTTRDMRWGTDSSTELVRQAQAPGPGFYTVETELDRNIRKWKSQRHDTTSTGKRQFGASGSERKVFDPVVAETPGPGSYEIP